MTLVSVLLEFIIVSKISFLRKLVMKSAFAGLIASAVITAFLFNILVVVGLAVSSNIAALAFFFSTLLTVPAYWLLRIANSVSKRFPG